MARWPQVFPHLSGPVADAHKLFELEDLVLISVPERRPGDLTITQTHDPIDERRT